MARLSAIFLVLFFAMMKYTNARAIGVQVTLSNATAEATAQALAMSVNATDKFYSGCCSFTVGCGCASTSYTYPTIACVDNSCRGPMQGAYRGVTATKCSARVSCSCNTRSRLFRSVAIVYSHRGYEYSQTRTSSSTSLSVSTTVTCPSSCGC